MSRRRSREPHGSWLGSILVATLVAGVTYGVFKSEIAVPSQPGTASSTSAPSVPEPRFLVTLVKADGTSGAVRVEPGTGRIDFLPEAPKPEPEPLAIRPSEDGASSIIGEHGWNVALRSKNGQPYAGARLVARFDDARVAVSASSDGPKLLVVERAGVIREAYALPEAHNIYGVMEGALWLSTAQPGPWIESPPQGPGTIVRISSSGEATAVRSVDDAVAAVSAGPSGSLAYMTEQGALFGMSGSSTWRGTGRPLAWIDAQTLLIAHDGVLASVNFVEQRQDDIGSVGGVAISAVPER